MSHLAALDIANLPAAEDERCEYKSSATTFKSLKDKLACAASGFWNSGGGVFIAGVDGGGKAEWRNRLRGWSAAGTRLGRSGGTGGGTTREAFRPRVHARSRVRKG